MSHKRIYRAALAVICMVSMLFITDCNTNAYASGYEYVLLTQYSKTMKIGDEFYLAAVTSTGKKPNKPKRTGERAETARSLVSKGEEKA